MPHRQQFSAGFRFPDTRLTYIEESEMLNKQRHVWVRCICGNTSLVQLGHIRALRTRSCGCIRIETGRAMLLSHGGSITNNLHWLYSRWSGIKARCQIKTTINYKNYGAKGITVCDLWQDFAEFAKWVEEDQKMSAEDEFEVHRRDVTKGYSPSNCQCLSVAEHHRVDAERMRHASPTIHNG